MRLIVFGSLALLHICIGIVCYHVPAILRTFPTR
jgi:hypothetical protein